MKITTKQFVLLLLVLVIFSSCDKDYASLDTDIINSENGNNFSTGVAEYPITTYTKKYSAFASNRLSANTLGYYSDPNYGSMKAEVIAQLQATRYDPIFGDNVELDSVVLTIPYFSTIDDIDENNEPVYKLDSVYGLAPIKLSIHKNNYFLRDFDPYEDFDQARKYYSDRTTSDANSISTADIEGTLLYQNNSFLPSSDRIELTEINYSLDPPEPEVTTTLTPSLRVKLDNPNDTFWQELILDLEGSAALSNSNNFTDHFRGLYFKVENIASQGILMLLNFRDSGANLTLYYKNAFDEGDTDFDFIPNYADVDVDGDGVLDNGTDSDGDGINDEFDVDATGGTDSTNNGIDDLVRPKTGSFQMSFSGNVVNVFENENFNVVDGDPENGDELLYLKGGLGSMAVVNLFNGDEDGTSIELADFKSKNWLINEASLVFYVDQSMLLDNEPDRLFIYDLENKKPVVDYFLDQSINSTNGQLIVDHLGELEREDDDPEGQGIKYKIKITEHINSIFEDDSENVKLGLFVTSSVTDIENLELKDFDENNPNFQLENIISGCVLTPKGTILHGSNSSNPLKRAKLQIYYTEPNE